MLAQLAKILEQAAMPGSLGIAGRRAEKQCAADLKAYFQDLANTVVGLNLEHLYNEKMELAKHHVEMKLANVLRHRSTQLKGVLKINLEEGYLLGWNTMQIHEAEDPFPPAGPDQLGDTGVAAAAYAEEHAAELVTGIDETTVSALQDAIATGIEEQLGVGGTGQLIRTVMDDMTVARAEMIAATEMNDAFSQATLDKLERLGIGYVKWIAEDDACPECEPNDGEVVALGEVFPSGDQRPPVHPNCRCAIVGARAPEV